MKFSHAKRTAEAVLSDCRKTPCIRGKLEGERPFDKNIKFGDMRVEFYTLIGVEILFLPH